MTTLTPTPRRRVLRWTVIVTGGLAVLVPLTLFLVLVVSLGVPGHSPTVGEAQSAVRSYYAAIQRHDYPTAYGYLDPHATMTADGPARVIDSVGALASIAGAAEQNNGVITAYAPTDGQFEPGTTIVDLTVHVTRTNSAQDVRMQIGLTHGKWRILRTDTV